MSFTVNLPAELLEGIGLNHVTLKITLLVLILLGLIAYRPLALIFFTAMLTLGANLPDELAASLGIDKRILLATLVIMVAIPLYLRWKRDTHLWEG